MSIDISLSNTAIITRPPSTTSPRAKQIPKGVATEWEPYAFESIKIPKELFERRPFISIGKLTIAAALIALFATAVMYKQWLWLGVIGLGLVYAHLIELQHELLHHHCFKSPVLSRIVGFLVGLPMLISYSHYQYDHLRHHRYLGTPENVDPFEYNHQDLNSVTGFVRGVFNYNRYITVFKRIKKALLNETISDGRNAAAERRIKQEYLLFGILIAVAFIIALITQSVLPLLLWFAPLAVAEPAHFLIELPEHYGLEAYSNPNVFDNTRTISGSWFSHWFTNYNTLHTAHHYNFGVPMTNIPGLYKIVKDHVSSKAFNDSYAEFYSRVIKGEIRQYIPEAEANRTIG